LGDYDDEDEDEEVANRYDWKPVPSNDESEEGKGCLYAILIIAGLFMIMLLAQCG